VKVLKLILKIFGGLILLVVIGVGGFFGYEAYDDYRDAKAQLSYSDSSYQWSWHDKARRVQKARYPDGRLVFRKVNIEKNTDFRITKYDADDFSVFVYFGGLECEPGTQIDTGEKYTGGEPITLNCTDDGNSLYYLGANAAVQADGDPRTEFSGDYGGFRFSENIRYWDMSQLDRDLMLKKAVKIPDGK
jgi:hypothetical protein